MMPKPLVTVVLPTYNRFEFLPAAVQSVFDQTMRDWELVVADDGSGREVRDYLATLNDGARVRTLLLPHSGNPGSARNAGVVAARGRYIAFLDSDDVWESTKLERQLAMMRAEDGFDWSYTGVTFIDEHGKPLEVERNRRWSPYRGQVFERLLRDPASVRTPTVVVIMTALLRDVGGFDETIDSGEDTDLWMRLALRNAACIVGEPLARIRHHTGNQKRDGARAYAAREYSLRKLTVGATAAQRALLERERGLNALLWAVETAAIGGRWRALAMVGKSLPFGWKFGLWWYESAKAVARAYLPAFRARSRSGVGR